MTIDSRSDISITALGDRWGDDSGPTSERRAFPTLTLLAAALRRRWRVLAISATGGLILAVGASFLSPPAYSATTTILLRHSTASDPSRAMATEVQLLKTRTVAGDAIRRLGLSMPAKDLVSQYRVFALTDEVLRVTVDGPTGREAVRRADALAEAFLTFRRDELARQSIVVVDTLEERKRSITDELAIVTDNIAKPAPGTDPKVLGDLLARKAVLNEQLGQLRQRIDAAVVDPTSILAKSRVIDPAGLDSRSPVKALAFNVVTGIFGGLALGAGWVVFRELTAERVGRPVEVSLALRTAVPVRVGKFGGRRWRRRHFRRHLTRPNQEVAQVVANLRRASLVNSVTVPKLAVLSIECDGAAAMALACTALEYAEQGKTVLIADFSGASELAKLLRIRAGEAATLRPRGVSAPIRVTFPLLQTGGDTVPQGPSGAATEVGDDRPDAVLVLAKLDPAVGAFYLVDWVTAVVAMVAKGQCTVTELQVISEMIEGAGLTMDSAILVGVDHNEKGLSAMPAATSNRLRAEPLLGPTP